ncbi:5722_t:CDS:2 [Ambispora leptoticha]|uniref:5722_t:CDS:1 n=1 Tax=Ambispora leptoticha TaxID=144679 RepID=A0A9N9FUV3_9GLOM|nr:5722_t:CDS:2 [Ambispora leptoticha]
MQITRNNGPLNGVAKLFLEAINRGTKYTQIEQDIRQYLKRNNLTPEEFVKQLEKKDYRRHFRCVLGFCYERNIGGAYDPVKAFQHYKYAADNSHTYGYLFVVGRGIVQDTKRAYYWYQKAATNGDPGAQYWLAKYLESGIAVKKNEKLALEWYMKAVANNCITDEVVNAYVVVGDAYAHGRLGVTMNQRKAFGWFKKAAEEGNSDAMLKLAEFYELGFGTMIDLEEAKKWRNASRGVGEHDDDQICS